MRSGQEAACVDEYSVELGGEGRARLLTGRSADGEIGRIRAVGRTCVEDDSVNLNDACEPGRGLGVAFEGEAWTDGCEVS